ncbi:MAG: hypothetical protein JJU15_14085 [Pararhodobacter sp.]|nr:hypothetical protein [Pararhodobacter sp.]
MRRALCLASALFVVAFPALSETDDPLVQRAFASAIAACAQAGGTLRLPDAPVSMVDLTGDGVEDRLVSEAGAFCAPDLGYLGGSAGNRLHAIIGDHVQSLEAGNWVVSDLEFTIDGETLPPQRVLLLAVHGAACDSFGVAPCFIAYAWDGTRLISVMDMFGRDD